MRRIVHVTLNFLPYSEAWLYDLVTAPVPYDAQVVTAIRENEDRFPFEPVLVIPAGNRRGSLAWLHGQFNRRLGWPRTPANVWKTSLRRLPRTPDLFHAHFGPAGYRVVDAGLSPTITSFYGYDASERTTLARWGRAYRHLFRKGAAFVAEGPAMRERLIELGAPPSRTHVIPLIAHLDDWQPASLGDGESPRVLMTGRLVEKKGFAEGIAAFAEARRSRDDARLLILGAGPEEERLRLVTRSLGLEDAVEFVAPQPRERFRDFMRSCHVVLQPSRTASDGDAEGGAPTTLLEAQALGRVIVATDHADIPNVVDRETALLAPEADAEALADRLTTALSAPEEWPSRGVAARRFVESHHGRNHVATLLGRLYDHVLATTID
jgi:colanic acid/amylovoran biosynthesis glycosyltransferase